MTTAAYPLSGEQRDRLLVATANLLYSFVRNDSQYAFSGHRLTELHDVLTNLEKPQQERNNDSEEDLLIAMATALKSMYITMYHEDIDLDDPYTDCPINTAFHTLKTAILSKLQKQERRQ